MHAVGAGLSDELHPYEQMKWVYTSSAYFVDINFSRFEQWKNYTKYWIQFPNA